MKTKVRKWFVALSVVATCCGCQKVEPAVGANVASVNGEDIPLKEFMVAITAEAGPSILNRLVESRLILQEAKKQGLSAANDPSLNREIDRIQFDVRDKDAVQVFVTQAKANALLRILVLKNVKETELRDTYEQFREDLERYEVSRILLGSEDTAKQVNIALETGSKFDQLAATSSLDEGTKNMGGNAGLATRQQLLKAYGSAITRKILALRPGETTRPLHLVDDRYLILKLLSHKNTFEELRPYVEDIYVNRERNDFLYRLTVKSEIVSPFLPKETGNVKPPTSEKAPPLPGWSPAISESPSPEETPDYELPNAKPKYDGPTPVKETTIISPPK